MFDSTATRLAGFAAALVLAGGAAAGAGALTDADPPFQDCLEVAAAAAGVDGEAMAEEAAGHGGEAMVEAVPGADGLRADLAGVTLAPLASPFTAGATAAWRFRLTDCDGEPVRGIEPENGKLLHLIVVRSDLTAYQHLHPRREADGTWTARVATPRAGRYRAIADFVVDGRKYVLGTTLEVPGEAADAPLPAPARIAAVDGYDVELQRPAALEAGEEAQLTFRVTRDGRPVRDLEPYLGAYGHLVALHAPDLAYSHVHPAGEDPGRGVITFDTELDVPGDQRLFLQFRTGGRVHTVAFTETVD